MLQPLLPVLDGALVLSPSLFFYCEMIGDPPHWPRARARIVTPKIGKQFISFYVDAETQAHKDALAQLAALQMRRKLPTQKPVAITVYAFKRIPPSWSARDRADAYSGRILPTSKPDGDNYLKLAQDALNKIVWMDDAQIVDATVIKRYSTDPKLRIEVTEFVSP